MNHEFWKERWSVDRIGFHQGEINTFLRTYHDQFCANGERVLVPLCGKSKDMIWLAQRGHPVVGVEFVAKAVEDFFPENEIPSKGEVRRGQSITFGGGIELWNANIFDVSKEEAGTFSSVFDRAALIALPPQTRPNYVQHILSLMDPGARALIVTFAYDQEKIDGPPFSVPDQEVRSGYASHGTLEILTREMTADIPPSFVERGVSQVEQTAWLFTKGV